AVAASPPLGADQLVGLETWVWVPATEWDQTVSRDLPALFTVLTIGATPQRVTWHMGDGGVAVCEGRGLEWSPAVEAAGAAHCGYTYERSSAGQADLAFDAEADVEWEAWYQLDGGARVPLGRVSQATPFGVRVAEAQAINTGG
ncbi:MAG: hypothetical protein ACRD0U_09715, partial [Acidimicrobiales bacterium]